MRKAIVNPETGLVENVILASPGFEIPGRLLVPSDTAGPGDMYNIKTETFIRDISAPPLPTKEQQQQARAAAFQLEADPLFFKYQRGEATEQEWLDKIESIRQRYPYPGDEE